MQSDFLHQLDPNTYNLGVVQELYLDHLHNSCTTSHWYTICPKEHFISPTRMRLLLLVNKCISVLESSGKGHTLMLPFFQATDVPANGVWIHVDTNLPPQ